MQLAEQLYAVQLATCEAADGSHQSQWSSGECDERHHCAGRPHRGMRALELSPGGRAAPGISEDTDSKGPLQSEETDADDAEPGVGTNEV